MTILNLPVWSFEPNWTSSVNESLEWLTDVLQSPSGSEQRRSMRYWPRRTVDFTISVDGSERSYLDNMLMSYGAQEWYLPIWQEVALTTGGTTTFIECAPTLSMNVGTVTFIAGDTPYDFELAEIASIGASGFSVVTPLASPLAAGSRIFPVTVGRLTEQLQMTAMTDTLATAEPQFLVTQKPPMSDASDDTDGPLILSGLIASAYNRQRGDGGYTHENAGTSDDQLIFIHALYCAYEQMIDGSAEQRATANYYRAMAEQMLDAMGDGASYLGPMLRQPIPSDTDAVVMIHRLFAARGDVPGQRIVLDYEAARVGNVLTIPAAADGGRTFKVWQVYPSGSTLLYARPYAPAFDPTDPGTETQVVLTDEDWSLVGDTAVITLPPGTLPHLTWKVAYGVETDQSAPQNRAFEAYPGWNDIDPGLAVCSPTTFRHFERAMQKAVQHDTRPGMSAKWVALQLAMRRTAVRGQNITDLREAIQPMAGFDAIPVSGAPAGMYCASTHPAARGPSVIGGKASWMGYDWWSRDVGGNLVASVPASDQSDEIIAIAAKGSFTATWRRIDGDISSAPVTLRINGRPYPITGGGGLGALVSVINTNDPDVLVTGTGGSGVNTVTLQLAARVAGTVGNNITLSVDGLNPLYGAGGSVSAAKMSGGVGGIPLGAATNVRIGRSFRDQWRIATSYQSADSHMYLSVGCSRKPDVAENEYFLAYLKSGTSTWYADLGALVAFVPTSGQIAFFVPRSAFRLRTIDNDGVTSWGASMPDGQPIDDFGISSEFKGGPYTIQFGRMRLVASVDAAGIAGATMPFFPGAMPFGMRADLRRQRLVEWQASPFHGHQLADYWWWLQADAVAVHPALTAGDLPIPAADGSVTYPILPTVGGVAKPRSALLMEQQLMFLQQAQDRYADAGGESGPFAHTFVSNTPGRDDFGNPTPHTWAYANNQADTDAAIHQTQAVVSLAELVLLTASDPGFAACRSMAITIVDTWLARLNVTWPDLGGQNVNGAIIYGMPTTYPDPTISVPQTREEDPRLAAQVLTACLTMRKAGAGDDDLHSDLILRCWNYLELMWQDTGDMAFTWSPDPSNKRWFGACHGDIIATLALMIDNPAQLPLGVSSSLAMERLVQTREWIEDNGVDRIAPNDAADLIEVYRDFHVLTRESDWTDATERGQARLLDTLGTETGIPDQIDTARRPFPTQRHQWVLDGLEDHRMFYALLQALRGRAIPVWVPTWMTDFVLALPVTPTGSAITVAQAGFTSAGGPRAERQDIMIELVDGRRFYRRITASVVFGGREVLALDSPLGEAVDPVNVLRICFMSLMRLDHDSIEIEHVTDIEGVSEVQVTFRAAPNSRVAEAAFYEV